MGHRIQKEFSSDRFKTMSRKVNDLNKDLGICTAMTVVLDGDNVALKQLHKQQGQAINELTKDIVKFSSLNDANTRCIADLQTSTFDLDVQIKQSINSFQSLQNSLERFVTVMIVLVLMLLVFCLINIGVI